MNRFPSIVLALLLLLGTAACSSSISSDEIPVDLEGKKALLTQKRAELRHTSELIAELKKQIDLQENPDQNVVQNRSVITSTVTRTDFEHFVEIQGSVEAQDIVNVTAEMIGRITNLTVEEGDRVERGQVIATLDTEQTKSQINEVETQLTLAKTVYERQKRLWDKNIGSEMQYLEAKNSVERLEKNLETMKVQIDKSTVHAPITGVVDEVLLKDGEVVSPGMAIVEILNTDRLKVVAEVPETYLRSVNTGEEVLIQYPALDMEQEERVTMIGRTIDPSNRTFKVEANVRKNASSLKPNLLATMKIKDFTSKDAVTIPLDVVQEEVSGKKYVFLVSEGPEGPVAKKAYVTIGRSYEGQVIVETGLEGGETLILEGGRGLADTQSIDIAEAKTEANNG